MNKINKNKRKYITCTGCNHTFRADNFKRHICRNVNQATQGCYTLNKSNADLVSDIPVLFEDQPVDKIKLFVNSITKEELTVLFSLLFNKFGIASVICALHLVKKTLIMSIFSLSSPLSLSNLYLWQNKVLDFISNHDNMLSGIEIKPNRSVIIIGDSKGNTGKSSFVHYLNCESNLCNLVIPLYPNSASENRKLINTYSDFVFGKTIFFKNQNIYFIFDLPRISCSFDKYDFRKKINSFQQYAENLLNGNIFSPWTDSFHINGNVFVICFTNNILDFAGLFSLDRLKCFEIDESHDLNVL